MRSAVLLFAVIFCTVYSQTVIKLRALALDVGSTLSAKDYLIVMLTDVWMWTAVVSTGLAAIFWLLAVRDLALSVAYPVLSAIFVLVPLAAVVVVGEAISPMRLLGIAIVFAGILVTVMNG